MGGQNSVQEFLPLPNGVQPALSNKTKTSKSLQGWGIDNPRQRQVPAVHHDALRSLTLLMASNVKGYNLCFKTSFVQHVELEQ